MLTLYPRETLGGADHGWLRTFHHFAFADYYDPSRVHFGKLRVINDDTVKAGTGFDPHPHKDMEIITYVRSGAVIHRDSLGNEGRTGAGDVQVMSAGTGITHAEYSDPAVDTKLFQIWIFPREKGVTPRWEQTQFPHEPVTDCLKLMVSGDRDDQANGALYIHQDARIYGGRLAPHAGLDHPVTHQAYVVLAQGEVKVGEGTMMREGDGLEVTGVDQVRFKAGDAGAEILVIDVPR